MKNMNHHPVITQSRLIYDLRSLGLRAGMTVMIHASVNALGWVVGGPDTVLRSLLEILTPSGTLMMYVSWEEWERALVGFKSMSQDWQNAYQEECPAFDPQSSRAVRQWSILTEHLRTWPGVTRSHHPTASVVAVGAQATWITQDHPLWYGYGTDSPFAKLCDVGGVVVLLGAPLNAVTLLHHAEHLAQVPDKRIVRNRVPMLHDGQRVWIEFEEYDTCEGIRNRDPEEYFAVIIREFLATGKGTCAKVGAASSYCFDAPELVHFARVWMERLWGA